MNPFMNPFELCPHCNTHLHWQYRDDGTLAYYCPDCGDWFTIASLQYWRTIFSTIKEFPS